MNTEQIKEELKNLVEAAIEGGRTSITVLASDYPVALTSKEMMKWVNEALPEEHEIVDVSVRVHESVTYREGALVADPYISFIWGRNWVELQDGQVK